MIACVIALIYFNYYLGDKTLQIKNIGETFDVT